MKRIRNFTWIALAALAVIGFTLPAAAQQWFGDFEAPEWVRSPAGRHKGRPADAMWQLGSGRCGQREIVAARWRHVLGARALLCSRACHGAFRRSC